MSLQSDLRAFNHLDLLKLMLICREGDRREGILLRQSKGWFQISAKGHEALAAMAYTLREDDYIFPYYRDRPLMLGRGFSNYELALAYFAKRGSSSGGRQMPGHYSCRERNVFSVSTPTGASLLPACGAAWAMKLEGKDTVTVATIGDATSRQGEFYEAFAFAIQEKLPIVFGVEDNKYGISTPTAEMMPFRLGVFNKENIQAVNGRDPHEVFSVTQQAVEKARAGEGPSILWFDLDRLASHTSSDDHRIYRPKEDIDAMESRDPIALFAESLIQTGELNADDYTKLQDEVNALVDEDYLRAEKDEDPRVSELFSFTLGNDESPSAPPIEPSERMTMVQAVNETFMKALESDPHVIFFGEDIEDPKGGVFGLTKGCSEKFPMQVFNSPLAEATIVGIGVGMAAYGWKPVFEVQFIDFIAPAWNQLTTNVSTLHWRSFGDWGCPLVLYSPYGAYLPGGSIWHSQANESTLAHASGMQVAIPSTPEDAAALFWTAIHSKEPAYILLPKHIFRKPMPVQNVIPVPFGKARTVKEGTDVTIVTWGNCLEIAEEAAAKSSASVEIVDLRSIVPCDYESITASVEKTGRLIVIHEDNHTGGFGQTILAEMTRVPDRWNLFLAPPQLVCRADVAIGYNPIYEYAALPSVDQVLSAIDLVME